MILRKCCCGNKEMLLNEMFVIWKVVKMDRWIFSVYLKFVILMEI